MKPNSTALPLDDGKVVRLFIENKRMGKIVWPYAVEALEAVERLENLATRADERRIMCDEKDETIKRLADDLRQLRDAWNAHFETCPSPELKIEPPTWDELRSWADAPSGTASA